MNNENDIKITFGKALRMLRENRNLTQEQLAEMLNLQTYQTINKIENGKSFVTSELLASMCKLFNVSPSFFFNKQPQIIKKDHVQYTKLIKQLLPSLSPERLKDVYNIMVYFQE